MRLYAGVARIEIETTVDNRSEDHRLRAFSFRRAFHRPSAIRTTLPEPLNGRPVRTEVRRDVVRDAASTHPAEDFYRCDRRFERGLMLANRALAGVRSVVEADRRQRDAGAPTLLRCVSWLSPERFADAKGSRGTRHVYARRADDRPVDVRLRADPHEVGWQTAFPEGTGLPARSEPCVCAERQQQWPRESRCRFKTECCVIDDQAGKDSDSVIARVYNMAERGVDACHAYDARAVRQRVEDRS